MGVPEAGRMELLERLVRSHQARLRAYLFSRTGRVEAADDLAQETFLVAFRRIEEFDPARPAWPWLVGIARNELREYWRSAARGRPAEDIEALAALRLLEQDESAAEGSPDRSAVEALRECLGKLTDRSRDLVRRIYSERRTCAEVARELRQEAGAVRVALHRIRRALHACVQATLAGGGAS
jgi:RNA polymerase sigma-70 factor (ECF subfamily)